MAVQYSTQKMVSDGTLSTIALGIQYLQRNDIYVRIAGVETPQIGAPSGYTWSFINNTTLKILPVVPNGVEVVVYRRTDVDAMYNVYSQNAQFDEATIDENNQQLLYIAQEYLEQGIPGAGVDTLEFVRDDGTYTYYRIKRTDGSYSDEFAVPSAGSATKIFAREALRRSYAEAGYNLVAGSFEAGGTVTSATDVLLYEATGVAYLWLGALPKVVPPTSSPATTGGLGTNGWLDIGDASLRGDLAATGGSSLIYDAKSTVAPGNVAKFGDITGIATLSIPDDKDQRLILQKEATQSSDYGTMQILRRANYTSGSSGFVGSALNVKTEARGVGSGQSEWAGLFTMESRSTQSGEWPQNVGVYSQGLKYTSSSTWAGCFEISDRNPVSGASGGAIGIEVSASANGADIAAAPQRNGVHIAISRGTIDSQDCEWGRGFWVTAGPAAHWIYGFSAENAGSYAYHAKFTGISADSALIRDESNCAVGLDLKRATYTTGRAIHLKTGHRIALDVDATQTLRGTADGPAIEGRLNLTNSFAVPSAGNTTSSAAAGTSGAAPSQVAGYITILVDGATKKIPFYN